MAAEQKKQEETNFWDKVAGERIYAAFSEKQYNEIFNENLNGLVSGYALDIGCASGVSAVLLSQRGLKVRGIDMSPKLIEQARRLWTNNPNAPEFSVGDAEHLPVESESCDICFFGGVLHHFPNYQKVINEAFRALKEKGILLIIEPNALDVIERISWFFAGRLKLLAPSEYPVSPYAVEKDLSAQFENFKIYPIRTDDIPFFSFIPYFGKFFKGGKGKPVKKIPLFFLNLFRPKLHQGNFFVLSCSKRKRACAAP